jgi:hypothetical protein
VCALLLASRSAFRQYGSALADSRQCSSSVAIAAVRRRNASLVHGKRNAPQLFQQRPAAATTSHNAPQPDRGAIIRRACNVTCTSAHQTRPSPPRSPASPADPAHAAHDNTRPREARSSRVVCTFGRSLYCSPPSAPVERMMGRDDKQYSDLRRFVLDRCELKPAVLVSGRFVL